MPPSASRAESESPSLEVLTLLSSSSSDSVGIERLLLLRWRTLDMGVSCPDDAGQVVLVAIGERLVVVVVVITTGATAFDAPPALPPPSPPLPLSVVAVVAVPASSIPLPLLLLPRRPAAVAKYVRSSSSCTLGLKRVAFFLSSSSFQSMPSKNGCCLISSTPLLPNRALGSYVSHRRIKSFAASLISTSSGNSTCPTRIC
mmetsp:Transcript_41763/g.102753  ORF Transcript_41763/g.102753 Transcript_41763/m.102753 type:complete len:201 (+) Transcript_41763:1520-2122(+)